MGLLPISTGNECGLSVPVDVGIPRGLVYTFEKGNEERHHPAENGIAAMDGEVRQIAEPGWGRSFFARCGLRSMGCCRGTYVVRARSVETKLPCRCS